MVPANARLVAAKDVVFCDLSAGAALLDLGSSTYYKLNGVGADIWRELSEPKSASELCAFVVERFDTDLAQCEDDVSALLTEFLEQRLVQFVPNE